MYCPSIVDSRHQTGSATLNPQELLHQALALHQAGKLDQAHRVYQRVLTAAPDWGDALHFFGVLRFQQGHAAEAIALVRRAIEVLPDYTDAHNNLGNMLLKTGQFDAARACYEAALRLEPDRIEALNNLGVLLRHVDDGQASAAHLHRAVELAPAWADAHYNLANTLFALQQYEAAAAHYRTALRHNPRFVEAFRRLGTLLYALQRIDESIAIYDEWLEHDPGNPVARHMRAAVSGEAIPERASDSFLTTTFDRFAASFDSQLERLEYRGPDLLAAALRKTRGEPRGELFVLDAGCGTGLCGPLLRPYAQQLIGVDISRKMLDQAGARQCYDRLVCAELTEFLTGRPDPLDLVVAGDALVYFGALAAVFQLVANALRPHGLFLFTVETLAGDAGAGGFRLCPHGRYAHSLEFVAAALSVANLELSAADEHVIRKELGQPVAGWVIVARRPG